MFFALCQCEIYIPQGRSLKGKRSVVNRIKERLRSRFHASTAEVDYQDLHQRAAIGIALVGAHPRSLEDALEAMRRLVEDESRCTITAWETRVEPFRGASRAPADAMLSAPPEETTFWDDSGRRSSDESGRPSSDDPDQALWGASDEASWDEPEEDDEHFGPGRPSGGSDRS